MNKRFTYENRIKYRKLQEGVFESCNIYQSQRTGGRYRIKIDENEGWCKIINVGNRTIVFQHHLTDKKYLRKKARRKLVDLGVVFERAVVYYEKEKRD
jgi:hypothetical protein